MNQQCQCYTSHNLNTGKDEHTLARECPVHKEEADRFYEEYDRKCAEAAAVTKMHRDRDKLSTAPTVADCRWCDKKVIFVWEKWQHFTKTEQRECPTPLPFEEQLPRAYKPIEYDEMPGLMVTAESFSNISQNLAMLIRRLVVRVRMSQDAEKGQNLCDQAMEYLRKTGLASPTDILRVDESVEALPERPKA